MRVVGAEQGMFPFEQQAPGQQFTVEFGNNQAAGSRIAGTVNHQDVAAANAGAAERIAFHAQKIS